MSQLKLPNRSRIPSGDRGAEQTYPNPLPLFIRAHLGHRARKYSQAAVGDLFVGPARNPLQIDAEHDVGGATHTFNGV